MTGSGPCCPTSYVNPHNPSKSCSTYSWTVGFDSAFDMEMHIFSHIICWWRRSKFGGCFASHSHESKTDIMDTFHQHTGNGILNINDILRSTQIHFFWHWIYPYTTTSFAIFRSVMCLWAKRRHCPILLFYFLWQRMVEKPCLIKIFIR